MNVATLDVQIAGAGVRALTSSRLEPLAGFDLVIWDPGGGPLAGGIGTHGGSATLDVAASEAMLRGARHWRAELAALLDRGGTLCAFLPGARGFGVHTLQEIVDLDLLEALPGGTPARAPAVPAPARCVTGEPFRSFFAAAGDVLQVQAELPDPRGRVVCVSAATGGAAGTYDYRHPGHVLLLPSLSASAGAEDRTRLLHALRDLVRRLRRSGRLGPLAPWAEAWALPGEEAWREAATRSELRQREAAAALRTAREALDVLDLVKQLVAGDAAGAGRAAAHVLHALGAYAQPGMDDAHAVAFEHRGLFGVATLAMHDAPVEAERALCAAAACGAATGGEVRAALLYCAENDRPLAARRGPSAALQAAARSAGLPLVTADALLAAWMARDSAILDRLIGLDSPPR